MTRELLLAVDCSTTAAKAVVLDRSGATVAAASCALDLQRPGPGRHEQDADQWWSSTRAAVREAVASLGVAARDVAALAVTHQRESFVCVDGRGRPLRPAILWLDSRAHREIAELGTDRVHALSGKQPDTTPALYKIAWLARNEPATLERAAVVADVHAVLAHRLTGRWATSTASGDSLGLLDLRAGTWSAELAAVAGVRVDQLPELVPPGDIVGPLLDDVADDLGVPRGLPLVAGLGDGQAAGLGAGLCVEPVGADHGVVTGDGGSATAYVNLGTSLVCGLPFADAVVSPAFRTLAGAPPGTFVLETVLNAASYLASWFRREFGDPELHGAPDPALEAAAAAVAPGSDGLLTVPYWNCAQTPYWDPQARGAMIGWHGGHTRPHVYRSLLEGVAFELALHLDGLEAATGRRIGTLRAMGGGARSPLWQQIVADVTGRRIELCTEEETSARGAAVLAAAATEGSGDPLPQRISRAAATLQRVGGTVLPDAAAHLAYRRLAAVQHEIHPALAQLYPRLHAAALDT